MILKKTFSVKNEIFNKNIYKINSYSNKSISGFYLIILLIKIQVIIIKILTNNFKKSIINAIVKF